MTRRRAPRALLGTLLLLALDAASGAAWGKVRFLQGASETTVVNKLYPWTQSEACSCCVCWETTLGTIFAYWDDYKHKGSGPWERLLYGGNGFDSFRFQLATDYIYKSSGVSCKGGSSWAGFFTQSIDTKAATYVSNTYYGYSFKYDQDVWVWFGSDISDEIDADKPVYYGYQPEGTGAHAVTIIGYDDSDKTLFLYKNWYPVVTRKGFDEATDHETINITPGGVSSPPSAWTCASSQWEAHDGCHCACGKVYDPDCDDTSQTLKNCSAGQTCSYQGQCVGSSCTDECTLGDTRCVSSASYQVCGNHDSDSCSEWSAAKACSSGAKCSGKVCVQTCQAQCQMGSRQCVDTVRYQACELSSSSCPAWGTTRTCPAGQTCSEGQCLSELCANGKDDDGDKLSDCKDPDCASMPQCAVTLYEDCINGIDDDKNGFVDCADPDCQKRAVCQGPALPAAPSEEGCSTIPGQAPGQGCLGGKVLLALFCLLWLRRLGWCQNP